MKIVVLLNEIAPAALPSMTASAIALAHAHAAPADITGLFAGAPGACAAVERAARDLALGRLWSIADADLNDADFHSLGQTLATVVRKLGADMVIATASLEDAGDVLSAVIAWHLDWTHVARVVAVKDAAEDALTLVKRGGGKRRVLRVPLPLVLSVAPGTAKTPPATACKPQRWKLSDFDLAPVAVRPSSEFLGVVEDARASRLVQVTSAEALWNELVGGGDTP